MSKNKNKFEYTLQEAPVLFRPTHRNQQSDRQANHPISLSTFFSMMKLLPIVFLSQLNSVEAKNNQNDDTTLSLPDLALFIGLCVVVTLIFIVSVFLLVKFCDSRTNRYHEVDNSNEREALLSENSISDHNDADSSNTQEVSVLKNKAKENLSIVDRLSAIGFDVEKSEEELKYFICPITMQLMTDPVMAEDGHNYERKAISEWMKQKKTSPVNPAAKIGTLITNFTLKNQIAEFVEKQEQIYKEKLSKEENEAVHIDMPVGSSSYVSSEGLFSTSKSQEEIAAEKLKVILN